MKDIKSSGNHPINEEAEVDKTVFGGQVEGVRIWENGNKKFVAVGIVKKKKASAECTPKKFPMLGWFRGAVL